MDDTSIAYEKGVLLNNLWRKKTQVKSLICRALNTRQLHRDNKKTSWIMETQLWRQIRFFCKDSVIIRLHFIPKVQKKKKKSDIRPSMVTHTRNLCSAFTHPKCTHTHSSEHTHPEQRAAIYAAAPGEQLEVRCLAQGNLVMVLRMERALDIHPPHPPFCLTPFYVPYRTFRRSFKEKCPQSGAKTQVKYVNRGTFLLSRYRYILLWLLLPLVFVSFGDCSNM